MNNITMRRRTVLATSLLFSAGVKAQARTDDWPSRPIRMIVATAAGSGGDTFARLISTPLHKILGQPVVVEPKPGANGMIAGDAVAKAAGDGHTLLFAPSSSILLNPVMVAKMPYNPDKDLIPVAQVGSSGSLLVTNPASGLKNLADLVAQARANPGKYAYGSWGNGSSGHLIMEGIKSRYGLDMPHVAYKSTAALVSDLIGNNISVGFADIVSPVPHMREGRLVGLAQSGSRRWPATPDLPTLTEQGYKFEADAWYGVFATAGTPQNIVERLADEINRLQSSDELRARIEGFNMVVPAKRSAKQFADVVKSEAAVWRALANAADLKAK